MAIVVARATYNWRDAKGWIGRTSFNITGDNASMTYRDDWATVSAAVQAAIVNLTNAAFAGGSYPFHKANLAYGANAEYPAEWMKAVFQFSSTLGEIVRYKIPAPLLSITETDGITIINDGTNAAVVAFVNAVKTAVNTVFVSTPGGNELAHFEGGLVRFGKQPRRFNERIKSAKLVAGEGE